MRAIRIHETGPLDVVRLEEIPRPAPGPGEALVEVHAASLNHLDIWVRTGKPAPLLPHTLGSDGAGVVAELGPGSETAGVSVGDEVLVDPGISCGACPMCLAGEQSQCDRFHLLGEPAPGTLADYVLVPARNCYRKPARFSWAEAAAFGLTHLTAWRMLITRAELRPGETVLVNGVGGGVAVAALSIALAAGARVIVTSSSAAKIERARALGAAAGVDYAAAGKDPKALGAAIIAANGGRPVDVVVDSAGAAAWSASLRALRKGGRFVTCGATTGSGPPADIHRIFWGQLSILGSTMGTPREMREALALAEAGLLTPVVDEVFPLERAREAMAKLERGEQFGKVVVAMREG